MLSIDTVHCIMSDCLEHKIHCRQIIVVVFKACFSFRMV